ncbi:MAG: hypothetical protein NC819_02285 [Candidatus Omnitrophica bacterium]|nr:hypothetical protein [Candidatus Omnitrophota bacterium]
MERNFRMMVIGVSVFMLAAVPSSGIAAEHGGQEHGGTVPQESTAETGMTQSQEAPQETATSTAQAAVPAPVQPEAANPAAVPALKPIIITFSGELSSVDANAVPGIVTVQDRYGVRKEIAVPQEAKIVQGTTEKALTDLRVGDKLTIEYTYDVATGKRTAQQIVIGKTVSRSTS